MPAQVVAQFVMRGAEMRGGRERTEATHRIVALRDAAVILLHPIVQMAAGPVTHVGPQRLADGRRVGVAAVRGHLLGRLTDHRPGARKEAFGGVHIARRPQHRVDEVPVGVAGPIEITPAPVDLDVRLVAVPLPARFVPSLGAQALREQPNEVNSQDSGLKRCQSARRPKKLLGIF
jgi:hypothetical protein